MLFHLQNNRGRTIQKLRPNLTLVGSIAEGTKIGICDELDLMIDFTGVSKPPFEVNLSDPFHLYKNESTPWWLMKYFSHEGTFLFDSFMFDLLELVNMAIKRIFNEGRNPESLERITTNDEYAFKRFNCSECDERRGKGYGNLFEQCPNCGVTVSQTKIGICLQLQWRSDMKKLFKSSHQLIYCSVDLVPTFQISQIETVKLAESVNRAMMQENSPKGWFKHLTNYSKCDMVLEDVIEDVQERGVLNKVLLKILNTDSDRYYYIRPGHPIGAEKFSTEGMKRIYIYVKCLKKILDIDRLNLYMVKKLLMKPSVQYTYMQESIYKVPDLQRLLSKYIDYTFWEEHKDLQGICLPLKNEYRFAS